MGNSFSSPKHEVIKGELFGIVFHFLPPSVMGSALPENPFLKSSKFFSHIYFP